MKRPAINIRWRSKRELAKIRQAAKIHGVSINQFVIGSTSIRADEIIESRDRAASIVAADNLSDSED